MPPQAHGGQGPGWAGQALPPFSPIRVSWPRLGPKLEGQAGCDGTGRSWLPGQKSLSPPLKVSASLGKGEAGPFKGGFPAGSSLALPLPLAEASALSTFLPVLITCLKVLAASQSLDRLPCRS